MEDTTMDTIMDTLMEVTTTVVTMGDVAVLPKQLEEMVIGRETVKHLITLEAHGVILQDGAVGVETITHLTSIPTIPGLTKPAVVLDTARIEHDYLCACIRISVNLLPMIFVKMIYYHYFYVF